MAILDSNTIQLCVEALKKNTALSIDTSDAPDIIIEGHHFMTADAREVERLLSQHASSLSGSNVIYMALEIEPALASQLRQRGIQYIDGAGNANISRDGLRVVVTGKSRSRRMHISNAPTSKAPRFVGKAFKRAGLKIIFALLTDPTLVRSSIRDIAKVAGVSVGATTEALADLADQGYLHRDGRTTLMKADKLVSMWAELYPFNLRNKLAIGTYYGEPDWWRQVPVGAGIQFGGEIGADLVTNYLRPKTGTAYVQSDDAFHTLMQTGTLRKLSDGSSRPDGQQVDIYNAFWTTNTDRIMAPELVIYSDLLAIQDVRCRETANIIYDQIIAPAIKDYA